MVFTFLENGPTLYIETNFSVSRSIRTFFVNEKETPPAKQNAATSITPAIPFGLTFLSQHSRIA